MRGLVLKPVRFALFSICVLAGAALLAPQTARSLGASYEDQLSGLVLGLTERVFLFEIVGLRDVPRPEIWPLPICTVDEIRQGIADKILAQSIFSKCSVAPTAITSTPKNYKRRGWTWRTDMGDAEICRHYSAYFNEIVSQMRAIERDPTARNSYTFRIGEVDTPTSGYSVNLLKRAKFVSSACAKSTFESTFVP